jgi:hypothetical protein
LPARHKKAKFDYNKVEEEIAAMSRQGRLLCFIFLLLFLPAISSEMALASTLTVTSSNPDQGLSFAYRQKGQTDWQGGTTSFSNSFSDGTQLEIVLPFVAFSTGDNIYNSVSGCDSLSYWSDDPAISNSVVCSVTMNTDKAISVQYSSVTVGTSPDTPNIFWQSRTTGELVVWSMDGTANTGQTSLTTVPSGWKVVGIGDINKDGNPDLVLFNEATGDIYIYYVGDGVLLGGQAGGKVLGNEWKLVGLVDIDRDGSPDYLWRNQVTGQLYAWLLGFNDWHGIIVKQGLPLYISGAITVPDPATWEIVEASEFKGEGNPHMIGQNKTTGNIYIWYINGSSVTGGVFIAGHGDLNWKLVGAGDFDRDGENPDLLWRNQATGQNEVGLMTGSIKTDTASLPSMDTSWDMVGTSKPSVATVSIPPPAGLPQGYETWAVVYQWPNRTITMEQKLDADFWKQNLREPIPPIWWFNDVLGTSYPENSPYDQQIAEAELRGDWATELQLKQRYIDELGITADEQAEVTRQWFVRNPYENLSYFALGVTDKKTRTFMSNQNPDDPFSPFAKDGENVMVVEVLDDNVSGVMELTDWDIIKIGLFEEGVTFLGDEDYIRGLVEEAQKAKFLIGVSQRGDDWESYSGYKVGGVFGIAFRSRQPI